jgi:3-deoxy-D-manno-octulosonate 8-phosphate phosphatase (KDO 8-P phosphatase)
MTPTENGAAVVRLLALDVDGILTDGLICFASSGDGPKAFKIKDGHGIKLIQKVCVKNGG